MSSSFVRPLALILAAGLIAGYPDTRGIASPQPNAEWPYYYNAGRRLSLVQSTTRLALRVPAATKELAMQRAAGLAATRAVRDIRAGGLVELTVGDARAPERDLRQLALDLDAELLPIFYEPGIERDASTLFINDEILVRFHASVDRGAIEQMNSYNGVEIVQQLAYAPNGFRLRVVGGGLERNALTVANEYFESGLCEWSHPNFLAHRVLYLTPNDTNFANQWHLKNTGQGGGTVGADVDAELAWDVQQGSNTISVAVADTGIDWHHEDLDTMVDGVAKIHDPRDVVHGDNDPFPQPTDADRSHGTAASGVAIAAFNNALGVAGIAPKCRFVPIQLYAESTFTPNATEADAFTWAADHADVMSNSWGPDNPGTPLPDATRNAIDYANNSGRGGKGTVVLFAAGNENFSTTNNNYCSYSGCIAVAASTNFDVKSSYSNFGPAISVAACSSGGTRSISTTDVTGSVGYSSGNYTSTFGGTSSACPLAAGVAALILSANPNLTWRQVKRTLEQSAEKIDPAGGAYDAFGRSDKYGYGRVNAYAASRMASFGGADTPGLFNPATSTFYLRNSNNGGVANAQFQFGPPNQGWKAVSGDWNGDGLDSIGLYDPATGNWYLRNTNDAGAADVAFNYGPPGATPVVGDWNGDGIDTIGIYVPASGAFFLRNSNTAGAADLAYLFGPAASSFKVMTGDWDGNNTDTVGLYDPAAAVVYLRNAHSSGPADVAYLFGGPGAGWQPIVGDWNYDGTDAVGLYDTATSNFYLTNQLAAGPAQWVYNYGFAGSLTAMSSDWDNQ
jgi:hypothetical protein